MILEPTWLTILKRTVVVTVVIGAWLWMSSEEYEEEQAETPRITYTVPEPEPIVEEDEIDTGQIAEPEQIYGWMLPPEPVRKHVGKIKRKIKKTVKK